MTIVSRPLGALTAALSFSPETVVFGLDMPDKLWYERASLPIYECFLASLLASCLIVSKLLVEANALKMK